MNLYKERVLKHGLEWKKHKYLYKDANGNYVYPSDIAKKAGNKARELNAQGQATNVSMRKERAERIKAGNERLYNSKPAQFAKRSFNGTKIGEPINDVVKFAKRQDFSKAFKGNLAKPKTKEEREREIAKTDAELSEALGKIASEMAEDYAKDEAKKKMAQKVYEYDDIGAILADPKYATAKKKKKKKKLITHKTKTTVEHVVSHSDTYRSNAMNSHQRMIYKSQLKHGVEWKRHKYIRKEGDRYIYPEDLEGGHRMHGDKWDNSLNITGADEQHVDVHGNADVVLSKRYNDRALQSGNAAKMKAKMAVANKDVSKMDEAWKDARKADELYSKSRTGDEKKISSLMSSNIDKKAQAISRANYLDKEAKKSKIVARRNKINPDDQRKSAHAGHEDYRRDFHEGGSTEELERQKRKTKARKSASKRFNELDRNNIRTSSSMEPDVQKQHSQINSAHRMATEKRMAGNKHSDREWNRQNLYSVNYYDQSGSIERQKRKTALRKRHKK